MSAIRSLASRHAALASTGARCDGGYLRIYTGPQPASPEASATGTLLAEVRFGTPAFAAPSVGSMSALPIAEDAAVAATGEAGWFRALGADESPEFDGSCGLSGSGAELIMPSLGLLSATTFRITSLTLTQS